MSYETFTEPDWTMSLLQGYDSTQLDEEEEYEEDEEQTPVQEVRFADAIAMLRTLKAYSSQKFPKLTEYLFEFESRMNDAH